MLIFQQSKAHRNLALYHPQTKLRQGNVFTPVCDSVHLGAGVSVWGDSLSGGSLSGRPPVLRLTYGRYSSDWNAFLLLKSTEEKYKCLKKNHKIIWFK